MRTFPETENLHSASSPDMTAAVIIVCVLGYLRAFCLGDHVVQVPPFRTSVVGGDENLTCVHLDTSFPVKLWYRQTGRGQPLLLIGYRYRQNPPEMESAFTGGRVTILGDTDTKSILRISAVSGADSATYYCASSAHSAPAGQEGLVSQAADVIQNPTFIVSSPMKSISVTCEHDDSSKYTKSWYRQEKMKGPVLMGYTNYVEQALMEPGFMDSRIEIKPESSQKSILTITEVSAQDTAVYFCASSAHSKIFMEKECLKP